MIRRLLAVLTLTLGLAGQAHAISSDTYTSRMGLTKPSTGSFNWGVKINLDLDIIDSSAAVQNRPNVFSNTVMISSNPLTMLGGDIRLSTATGGSSCLRFSDGSFQCTAGAGGGGSGSGSGSPAVWIRDDFTSLTDGIRSSFTFSTTPASLPGVFVFLEGVGQKLNSHYTINFGSLTMTTAPEAGSSFYVIYSTGGSGGGSGGGGGSSGLTPGSSTTVTGNWTFTNPIHVSTRASDPSGYGEGALYANTGDNRLHLFINGQWRIQRDSSQSQVFTSNGTFTVPTGVSLVWVTMCAGGGGGGSGTPGGGGGGGESLIYWPINVTPGASMAVTVGSGGPGGTGGPGGSTGSSSSFGGLTVSGGSGGAGTTGAGAGGNGGGYYAGSGGIGVKGSTGTIAYPIIGGAGGGEDGFAGGVVGLFTGGAASSGGGGGASAFGSGGAGAGAPGSGTAGGTCAGGGGAGAGGGGTSGGAGGNGQVIVEWIGP